MYALGLTIGYESSRCVLTLACAPCVIYQRDVEGRFSNRKKLKLIMLLKKKVSTLCSSNAGLMSAQSSRRWANRGSNRGSIFHDYRHLIQSASGKMLYMGINKCMNE